MRNDEKLYQSPSGKVPPCGVKVMIVGCNDDLTVGSNSSLSPVSSCSIPLDCPQRSRGEPTSIIGDREDLQYSPSIQERFSFWSFLLDILRTSPFDPFPDSRLATRGSLDEATWRYGGQS